MCHRAPGEDDSRELVLAIHYQVLPGAELVSSDLMQASWHHEPLYQPINFFIADCLSALSKCGVTYQNMAPHPDTSCDIIWLFLDLSHEHAWAETGGGGEAVKSPASVWENEGMAKIQIYFILCKNKSKWKMLPLVANQSISQVRGGETRQSLTRALWNCGSCC